MSDARLRIGKQLATRRKQLGWKTVDLARRLARPSSRVSEIETGRANANVDSLAEMGAVMRLALVFVPEAKLPEVMAMLDDQDAPRKAPLNKVRTIFEEVFIPDPDDE